MSEKEVADPERLDAKHVRRQFLPVALAEKGPLRLIPLIKGRRKS
jgi:hypothetical protein